MSYIQFAGIDVRNKNVTKDNFVLQQNSADGYLTWSWYMLYTDKVNEVPAVLTKVINYISAKDESTITLHTNYTNLAHAYLLSVKYETAKSIYEKI
jgi:hypothetical protein